MRPYSGWAAAAHPASTCRARVALVPHGPNLTRAPGAVHRTMVRVSYPAPPGAPKVWEMSGTAGRVGVWTGAARHSLSSPRAKLAERAPGA